MGGSNGYWMKLVVSAAFIFTAMGFGYTWATNTKIEKAVIKIADEIICNDRIRQQDNKEIAADVRLRVDTVNREVAAKLDKMQSDISDIKITLARTIK